jgi:hypothetical protein
MANDKLEKDCQKNRIETQQLREQLELALRLNLGEFHQGCKT